jgi:predicted transcriptional regulator
MAQAKKKAPEVVSIRASKQIKTRLKIYAAKNETDMSKVADAAIDEYLKKRGA